MQDPQALRPRQKKLQVSLGSKFILKNKTETAPSISNWEG